MLNNTDTEETAINWSLINVDRELPLEVVNSATSLPSSLHRKEWYSAIQKSSLVFLNFITKHYTFIHLSYVLYFFFPVSSIHLYLFLLHSFFQHLLK